MSEDRSWREIFREVTAKAKNEIRGPRKQQVKQTLLRVRDELQNRLNSEDTQRGKDRLQSLSKQADQAIERLANSKAAAEFADGVDDAISSLDQELAKIVKEKRSSNKSSNGKAPD
jgi:hypothetical protein